MSFARLRRPLAVIHDGVLSLAPAGPGHHPSDVLALLLLALTARADEKPPERVPVRIGWQIPAATQAQLVEVLKRTDVLELHGLDPRPIPFSYGTPLVDAALAGELDVAFIGDQSAIDLLARGGHWRIVARLHHDRVAVLVPSGSPIRTATDLRGRTVASPFGSTGHREVTTLERDAGLDPHRDVNNVDLDILEIRRRVQAGGDASWGSIDAVAVWEPMATQFEIERVARNIGEARTLTVVAMSDDFITGDRDAAIQFLAALPEAWSFLARNGDRVERWYLDDVHLGYTPQALTAAARVEPLFTAHSAAEVVLGLTQQDLDSLERAAAWARAEGYATRPVQLEQAIDGSLLMQAGTSSAPRQPLEVVLPPARETPAERHPFAALFDRIPLGAFFTLTLVLAWMAIEVGRIAGERRKKKAEHEAGEPVGTVVAAVLGLLALVIALTFSAAGDRFDARKQALLDEVNAIGTAYLRADLLAEPHRTTTRVLLRDYVEVRLDLYKIFGDAKKLQLIEDRTASLQASIWSHADALMRKDPVSQVHSLFVTSLNEVFDMNTTRIVLGAQYRIPFFVWVVLWLTSGLAMVAVGFHFGLTSRRSWAASATLAATFALVMLLILDLDRPSAGFIEVNQQPMADLFQSMNKAP